MSAVGRYQGRARGPERPGCVLGWGQAVGPDRVWNRPFYGVGLERRWKEEGRERVSPISCGKRTFQGAGTAATKVHGRIVPGVHEEPQGRLTSKRQCGRAQGTGSQCSSCAPNTRM